MSVFPKDSHTGGFFCCFEVLKIKGRGQMEEKGRERKERKRKFTGRKWIVTGAEVRLMNPSATVVRNRGKTR